MTVHALIPRNLNAPIEISHAEVSWDYLRLILDKHYEDIDLDGARMFIGTFEVQDDLEESDDGLITIYNIGSQQNFRASRIGRMFGELGEDYVRPDVVVVGWDKATQTFQDLPAKIASLIPTLSNEITLEDLEQIIRFDERAAAECEARLETIARARAERIAAAEHSMAAAGATEPPRPHHKW